MKKLKPERPGAEPTIDLGLGGILKGLGNLVEKLGELAEAGREISKTGEISGLGKDVKGVYGFTLKLGLGGEGTKVEPFGNIRRDERSGRPVVHEVIEPAVDVFEEADHALVVAEIPGIGPENVQLQVQDDLLVITAERGAKKYRKEVLLPDTFPRDKMKLSCTNGVLEIRCVK